MQYIQKREWLVLIFESSNSWKQDESIPIDEKKRKTEKKKEERKKIHVKNHEKVEKNEEKCEVKKENGDQITHMCYNWIVGMFLFFKICILLSEKTNNFLEAQPHYSPGKDLKIHVSNMSVI